eukprot:531357-Pelagomonas_calceolata.AAC.2
MIAERLEFQTFNNKQILVNMEHCMSIFEMDYFKLLVACGICSTSELNLPRAKLTWPMTAASHGVTQGVSWCCGAEHPEFGVCAHAFGGLVRRLHAVSPGNAL